MQVRMCREERSADEEADNLYDQRTRIGKAIGDAVRWQVWPLRTAGRRAACTVQGYGRSVGSSLRLQTVPSDTCGVQEPATPRWDIQGRVRRPDGEQDAA